MPLVNIRLARRDVPTTAAQKAALIAGVTQLMQQVLDKRPESVTVIIDEWWLPARSNQVESSWPVTVTSRVSPSHLATDWPIQESTGGGPGSVNRMFRTAPAYS